MFELTVHSTAPKKQKLVLVCTELLREVPGKRCVYKATLDGQAIVAKVFSSRIGAERKLRREWQGLTRLRKLGLNAPQPLLFGTTDKGEPVMATEEIAGENVFQLYRQTNADEKASLIKRICEALAKLNAKGVLQRDLHLGNFLIDGRNVYALDAREMVFYSQPLNRTRSLAQLATILSVARELPEEALEQARCSYFENRGWRWHLQDEGLLKRYVERHRTREIRRQLKKTLRTSTRYMKIKTSECIVVFEKQFCLPNDSDKLICEIDKIMDEGQILKDGNTCYVSKCRIGQRQTVIKRYNHKGLFHSLRHTVKRSRARRAWLCAHRLTLLNIATPRPLAYVEQHRSGLIWKSYLVTEYIEGRNLRDILTDDEVSREQRSKALDQVGKLFEQLAKHNITHGDLKHTNFLITDYGAALTDLDDMKVHRWASGFRVRQAKDMVRFKKELRPDSPEQPS